MSYTRFPSRFGKYILLDRLNSGGMAEVYRAKVTGAEEFQRLVAIKSMLPQLLEDQQFSTMFVDEAKLAAQLAHANIVQIYELGRIGQQLYIAMELVNGRDLRHILKRARSSQTPIPTGFAAYVVSKAAEGLDFAHRKLAVDGSPLNLVHRDVSPQNILVSFDGEVKVVDFGIAKAEVRDTRTRAGVLKGKFAYMAPEMVGGAPLDRRADIFALGAVFFEVLTGQKLFRGESDFSILEKVREADIPSVREAVVEVAEDVDHILESALAKDPADRYSYASDMAEDLTPLLIENRSIFGTKQAKEFMQALYDDDIAMLAEQLRNYSEIGVEDCIESSLERQGGRSLEIFESEFESIGAKAGTLPRATLETLAEPRPAGVQPLPQEGSSTGWTHVDTEPGFGEELSAATSLQVDSPHLLVNPSQRVSLSPGMQSGRAVVPQPYGDGALDGSSGFSGSMTTTEGSGLARPILMGLIVASLLVLVAVVVVYVTTRGGAGQAAPVPVPVSRAPAQPTSPDVSSPEEHSPAKGETEPSDRGSTPKNAPVGAGHHGPRRPPERATRGGSDRAKEVESKDRRKPKPKNGSYSYLNVKAAGVSAAVVFVDGKEAGYSPLAYYKLRPGRHRIRVVEQTQGRPPRSKEMEVLLSPTHTRKNPLFLKLDL